MTSKKIARDYLGKVEVRLEALRLFLARGRNDDVIREAHEALELLLKGALRFVGIDPPRRHDPAPVLLRHLDRFPPAWQASAAEICATSERLFAERGHAFYANARRWPGRCSKAGSRGREARGKGCVAGKSVGRPDLLRSDVDYASRERGRTTPGGRPGPEGTIPPALVMSRWVAGYGRFSRSARSFRRPEARLFIFRSSRPMTWTGTPSITVTTRRA